MTDTLKLNFPEVFLVETFDTCSGVAQECDVYAKLELAVEAVYEELVQPPGCEVRVEVSLDEDGELEGVGFFDRGYAMLACITVYRLERENDSAVRGNIADACRGPVADLEAGLARIFRPRP